MHDQPLKNQIAMVTGASTGIGRATAIQLAKLGAEVVVHGRSESPNLLGTIEAIRGLEINAKAVVGDFAQADFSHSEFVDEAVEAFGDIHHWINNAGGDVLTGERAEWNDLKKMDYLWRTDVLATLELSRAFARHCVQRSSGSESRSITNIGWDQALQGMAGKAGEMFATTKGAIVAMSRSLAQSWAPNVRVNCVAPGWIKTDWGENTSEYWDQRARNESLMKRWGAVSDVADAIGFLTAHPFMAGVVLPVNGGFRHSQLLPDGKD